MVVSIPLPFTGARLGGFWSRYGTEPTAVVVLGLVIALDDWVSHALGAWTPLDWVWGAFIYPVMSFSLCLTVGTSVIQNESENRMQPDWSALFNHLPFTFRIRCWHSLTKDRS